jgi:hypothetical protein
MSALIIAAAIALFALVFVLRTIVHKDGSAKHIVFEPAPRPSCDLLPADMKLMVDEAETGVCRKADLIVQMAEDLSGDEAAHEEEPRKNSLEETSFMKSISDKVEQVKRISGVKS